MIRFTSCALALTFAVAVSGTAFAATMTSSEKATMKECQGMSQSAMQKDKNCVALMKKYPSAMKSSGSMNGSGSGSMGSGSMNNSSGSMGNSGGSMGNSGGGMSK